MLLALVDIAPAAARQASSSGQTNPGQGSAPSIPLSPLKTPPTRYTQQTEKTTQPEQTIQPATETTAAPTAVDPAGPAISLETSEALFEVAVGLNVCGYDYQVEASDPVRRAVRSDINDALVASAAARIARDSLCSYIVQHRLSDAGRDLAQYVSLALYLTPPPALALGADESEMPPDSTQVIGVLPPLRGFAEAVQLHSIWLKHRPEYEQLENLVHDPLEKIIFETNVYLKQPTSSYDARRFLVLLEPMLAPGQANARIYGGDYIVVASPVRKAAPEGASAATPTGHPAEALSLNFDQIRHTYLHYEIEPLVYAKSSSMERLLPLLKTVREAPLDFTFRSDIVSLLTESLIRAIEARTLNIQLATGQSPPQKPGAVKQRSELEKYSADETAYLKQAEAARQALVARDMRQGYVLTAYFYQQIEQLEKSPVSLKENMGEMIYGMDVDHQRKLAEAVVFYPEGSSDVVRRAPRQLHGLDLAEMDLIKGDTGGAKALAQQAVDSHTGDAARANYLLARIESMQGQMNEAAVSYTQTIKLSHDPRTLAWSHIYLGRIYDIQDKRPDAVAEYRAALTVRDSQQDTRLAAEKGLKQQFQSQRQLQAQARGEALAPEPAAEPASQEPAKTSSPVANDPQAPADMVPDANTPLPPALPPARPKKK